MEHYLIIDNEDWTPRDGFDSKSERWYYAAPGGVSDLIQSLLPKTKREKRDPNRFRLFTGAIFAAWPSDDDLRTLMNFLDAYRMVATPAAMAGASSEAARQYLRSRQPFAVDEMPREDLVDWVRTRLFDGQQGGKLGIGDLVFSSWYRGEINYQGTDRVEVSGDFGNSFRTVANYRWDVYVYSDRTNQLWPEFEKDDGVEIRYIISEMDPGDSSRVSRRRIISEEELGREILMVGAPATGTVNIAVEVRGKGHLALGPVHYRWSRFEAGNLIPGGERLVDPIDRGELDFYFNPGDLRPPLNVYFSGYRMVEGFEGYYMMRSLKSPFILVTDPRLEGGSFYLGSPELEQSLKDKIQEKVDWLGFTMDQVNFSGGSMGSFGACYYGVQMRPHAMIVMSPLLNLGKIAKLEMTSRFGVFPTSLDLLRRFSNDHRLGDEAPRQLDARFWDRFKVADLSRSKFMITYMENDNYDSAAYRDLLRAVVDYQKDCPVFGHGIPGNHTDNWGPKVVSFKQQYRTVMQDDFGRK